MSEHLFPGKTVNFVLASNVVARIFLENISELNAVKTTWTPQYAEEFEARANRIAGEYLGVNNRNQLFKITQVLNSSITTVKDDLITLRKHIEADFKRTPEYDIIMTDLGLKNNTVKNLTQSELIALALNIKRTLTPELITKITSKGMPATLPQRIADNAATITDYNNQQEKLKNSTKEVTGAMLTELNALYEEIINICKLASDFYKKDPVKKSLFTFSKILKNQGESRVKANKEQPTA